MRSLMAGPDAKRPTAGFMGQLERTLLDELKSIAADENVLQADSAFANAAHVPPSPRGEIKNQGSSAAASPKRAPTPTNKNE